MNNVMKMLGPKYLPIDKRMNIEKDLLSLETFKYMLIKGIISQNDFIKSELFLMKKYRINKDSIYRPNDLIKIPFRKIYSTDEREDWFMDTVTVIGKRIEPKKAI